MKKLSESDYYTWIEDENDGCDRIGWPHNCYDKETEILTNKGYKYFKDLNGRELVATLNSETNELEYHKPIDYQKFKYKGELINFRSKSFNLTVTPDHKMYVKTNRNKHNYEFIESKKLIKSNKSYRYTLKNFVNNYIGNIIKYIIIPECKDILNRKMRNSNVKKIKIEDYLKLISWYLTEGSMFKTERNYVINITQYKKKYRKEIINLIKKIGYKPYITDTDIRIHSKQLYMFFKKEKFGIGAKNKSIPRKYLNIDKKYLKILFETLMKGDGNKTRKRYTTISKELKDNICEICFKIGKSTNVTIEYPDNIKYSDIYRINISKGRDLQIGNNRRKEVNYELVEYNDFVYDLTVKNHIIFVRRNGKSCWSSNCYGKRQNLSDPYRNVIGIFMNRILNGKPPLIYGDGEQTRAFTYIEDVIPYFIKAMDDDVIEALKKEDNRIINVGNEEPTTLNELSRIIIEKMCYLGKAKHRPDRPEDEKYILADNLKEWVKDCIKELRKEVDKYKTLLKCDTSCLGICPDNNYFRQLIKNLGKIEFLEKYILEDKK